jgi:hypothetical protein
MLTPAPSGSNHYARLVVAVVLRGPANTAPDAIVGPFASMHDAEQWAAQHLRPDGYSVAQELVAADEFSGDTAPG